MISVGDIIAAIERVAPRSSQESWDNSGLCIGNANERCLGVMISVDVTPEVVAEAVAEGCNLIVSHHPLIFRGLKRLTGDTLAQQAVVEAVRQGVNVYCCHTPIDRALRVGVSIQMAKELGLSSIRVLEHAPHDYTFAKSTCAEADDSIIDQEGLGAIGTAEYSPSMFDLIDRVKAAFGSKVVRTNCPMPEDYVPGPEAITLRCYHTIALCGGSGAEFIDTAIRCGADAYITSDIKYHDFLDYRDKILLIDIGHFEAENCTKSIFYNIISEKFPNFAVRISKTERNTINYV